MENTEYRWAFRNCHYRSFIVARLKHFLCWYGTIVAHCSLVDFSQNLWLQKTNIMKKCHEKSVDLQNFFENFITFLFELTLYVNLNGKQSYNHPSFTRNVWNSQLIGLIWKLPWNEIRNEHSCYTRVVYLLMHDWMDRYCAFVLNSATFLRILASLGNFLRGKTITEFFLFLGWRWSIQNMGVFMRSLIYFCEYLTKKANLATR